MTSPNLPPHDPGFRPNPPPGPHDPRSLQYDSPFYPNNSEAVREAEKHASFARELLAHTPHAFIYHLIIAANVIVYIAFGFATKQWMTPEGLDMINWGADKWEYTTGGQWWALLTSAFLHFGPIHLFANMYALLIVGNLAERLFGNLYFAILYLMSALLSGLVSVWWDRTPDGTGAVSAGALGAIFAVYGAIIAFLIVRRGAFPKAMRNAVMQSAVVFVGINVVFGLSQSGISNAAHFGGLASGLLLGAIMARPVERTARKRQAIWRLAAGAGFSCLALAVMIIAIPKVSMAGRANVFVTHAEALADLQADALEKKYESAPERKAEYGAAIRKKAIKPWADAFDDLTIAAKKLPTDSPDRPLFDLYLEYARLRRDAYTALAESLETNDAKKAHQYRTLMFRSNGAVARIKQLIDQAPGR